MQFRESCHDSKLKLQSTDLRIRFAHAVGDSSEQWLSPSQRYLKETVCIPWSHINSMLPSVRISVELVSGGMYQGSSSILGGGNTFPFSDTCKSNDFPARSSIAEHAVPAAILQKPILIPKNLQVSRWQGKLQGKIPRSKHVDGSSSLKSPQWSQPSHIDLL